MSFFNEFAYCYDNFASYDYDKWAAYITRIFERYGLNGSLSVLDAACGTGNISVRLRGHKVTGLDQSADMLNIAAKKSRERGVNIQYIKGDITDIRLHNPVDAIIMVCDGLNYLTSDRAITDFFTSAYNNLKKSGALAFDISSRYKIENILAGSFFAEENDDAAYIWQNSYDERSLILSMDITAFIREHGGMFRRTRELHRQKAYDILQVVERAKACGFKTEVFDCFTFEPPTESSERIQFVCRPVNCCE